MAREKDDTPSKAELKELHRELRDLSEKLVETIKNHRILLGGTGVLAPKPPRPKMEILGRVAYAGLLLEEAVKAVRDLRK